MINEAVAEYGDIYQNAHRVVIVIRTKLHDTDNRDINEVYELSEKIYEVSKNLLAKISPDHEQYLHVGNSGIGVIIGPADGDKDHGIIEFAKILKSLSSNNKLIAPKYNINKKSIYNINQIKNIIKTYPNKKFVLIGDAGEHDIDIYLDIVKHFPNRIKAIYIRTVNHKKRMLRIQRLIKDYTNVPVLLFKDSEEVLEHAKQLKLIA